MKATAMSIGLLFWIIMIIGFLFYGFVTWRPIAGNPYVNSAPNWIIWLLLFLLGWGVFGPPIHG